MLGLHWKNMDILEHSSITRFNEMVRKQTGLKSTASHVCHRFTKEDAQFPVTSTDSHYLQTICNQVENMTHFFKSKLSNAWKMTVIPIWSTQNGCKYSSWYLKTWDLGIWEQRHRVIEVLLLQSIRVSFFNPVFIATIWLKD